MSHYLSGIPLIKKRIEIQLSEYEAAIVDAVKWHQAWKSRQAAAGSVIQVEDNESQRARAK